MWLGFAAQIYASTRVGTTCKRSFSRSQPVVIITPARCFFLSVCRYIHVVKDMLNVRAMITFRVVVERALSREISKLRTVKTRKMK